MNIETITGENIVIMRGTSKEPPTEFLIWAYGVIKTSKYPDFTLTPESAAACVADAEKHGIELSIDYEHSATRPADGQPTPAAGWFKLEARADGLWAVAVRWTPRAADMLVNGEYRHFSPVAILNKGREVIRIYNCGLTNTPATVGQAPLVAAKGMVAAAPSDDASTLVSCIARLLDVSGTSTLTEAQAWLEKAREQQTESAEKHTERAIAAALFDGKIAPHQRETYVSLAKTIGPDALEKAFSAMEVRDTSVTVSKILDRASEEGRIPPGMRSQWLEAGRAIGAETLAALVASMGTVGGMEADALALASKPGDPGATPMDPELRRMLRAQGLTERDHREALAYERAQREEGAL